MQCNAMAKHQQENTGICVLKALSYAYQPNRTFNWDVNASHCRPLTLALGPVKQAPCSSLAHPQKSTRLSASV